MESLKRTPKELEKLHYDVLEGRSDYIPLVIRIRPRECGIFGGIKNISPWDGMKNPSDYLEVFLENNKENMRLPTDRVITIESNFVESLVPSMFGGNITKAPGGIIEVKPFADSMEELLNTDISDGQLEEAKEHLLYLKRNIPEDVHLSMTRFMSPLDYGVVMRGGEFYMDLLCEPELCMEFMEKVADLSIKTMKEFKDLMGEPYEKQITAATGFWFHGTRLTGDSIVNVSPDVIKNMLCPVFDRYKKELGGVMLHYCCTPAPSGHVLPTLAECDSVRCVDNWQGVDTYFDEAGTGRLQDKVSMFADFPIEEVSDIEKFLSRDIFSKVKRNGGRGFVVRTDAENVDEAARLYDKWREYFEKKNIC